MTASTPRGPDPEVPSVATDLRRATPAAARRGLLVAVLALGMGQIPPLIMNLAGAHLAVVTELRLGWLYTVASNVAPIRMERYDDAGGSLGIATFRIGLLTITILVLWALAAGGAHTAEVVAARPVRRAIAGAMVAIAYTAPLVALGAVVSLKLNTGGVLAPGSVELRAAVLGVVAVPLVLGLAAGAAGGLATLRERGDLTRAALAGGWRMLAVALGLSLIGLLAIAALRPSGLQGYVDELTSQEPRIAALILGHQALLLPNQAALVLVPAMGACDTVTLDGRRTEVVCLDREPRGRDPAAWLSSTIDASGSPPTRANPWTVRLLLLVPAGAAVIGGWRAADGARSVVEGVLRSLLAAGVFAVLVGATVWASTIAFTNGPGPGRAGSTQTLAIGAPPLESAGYALAWGALVGGVTGSVSGLRRRGTRRPGRDANPA